MAQFVTFTDLDGLVTRLNPADVVSLYPKPSNPLLTVIRLNDNSTYISNQSIAVLQSLFSVSDVVSLDVATLAALESITIQNPGGVSAVNIQDGGNSITVDGTVGISGTVTVTGALTDTQLRASAVSVSGTVTANQGTSPWVTSVSGSVTVTGPLTDTQLRATPVPVSGPLTDTQLRATPVPISGTVTVTDGSGPITVDGTVSISGTVGVTQSTSPWVVSGTVTSNQGTSPWVTSLDATTLAALESITVQNPGGASAVNIQDGGNSITVDGTVAISGTVAVTQSTSPWVISGTVTDSTAKAEDIPATTGDLGIPILAVRNDTAASKTNTDGDYSMLATDAAGRVGITDLGGSISIDDNAGSITVDGTVAVTQTTSPWVTSLDATTLAALESITVQNPSGAGAVNIQDGGNSITVDGSVSITGSVAVTGPLTDTQLRATPVPISGTVTVTDGAGPLTVDGTVSISGTVGVTQSTSPWVVSNTVLSVVGGGTEATAQRVTIANNSTGVLAVTDNGGSLTVDGSVSITGSVAVTGPLTDTQLRASSVPVSGAFFQATQPVSGPLTDTQLRATPVPISGTVTVTDGSGPLTVDGTVAATQSGSWSVTNLNGAGAAAVNIQDGGNSITVDGTVGATQSGAWSVTNLNGAGAAAVNIQDGGNSITVDGTVSISGSVAVTGPLTDAQLRATPVPVTGTQQLGTITNGAETAVSSTAVQILASNASRKKYLIQNTGTANIRVGTTGVTATTGARIVPNGSLLFEMPNCPTQAIFAIREGTVDSIAFAEEIT